MSAPIEIVSCNKQNISYFQPLLHDFIPHKESGVLGAVAGEIACGVAVIGFQDDSIVVHYLYIAEQYRRQHIGSRLMDVIMELADGQAARLCAVYCDDEQWVHEFLGARGFIRNQRATAYEMPFAVSAKLGSMRKAVAGHIIRLDSCMKLRLRQINYYLESRGSGISVSERMLCDEQCSFVLEGEHGAVDGLILCNTDQTRLYVEYLYAKNPRQVMLLIARTLEEIERLGKHFETIRFLTKSAEANKLAAFLFPDSSQTRIFSLYHAVFEL